jgi:predicted outer membrane protein
MVKGFIAIAVSLILMIFIAPVGAQQDKPSTATGQHEGQHSMKSMEQGSDGEIFAFLVAVDEHEVAAGKEASQKATAPSVKQYAQTMVKEHSKHLDETQKLMNSLSLQPSDTSTVDQLKTEAESARKRLSELTGPDLDAAYIDQMVKDHASALDHIDNHFMKATTNAKVLKHLEATRTAVAKHHEDAVRIQGMLKK